MIEDIKFEVAELKKEQRENNVQLHRLLTENNAGSINKFCKMLPISSMETFDEIENCLITSANDYASLVSIIE